MAEIRIKCPNCGTMNSIDSADAELECGILHCACTCENCKEYFEADEDYWHWLELDEDAVNEIRGS